MDGRQSLGIALGDRGLSAVLLQASGRTVSVAATATVPLDERETGVPGQLATALNRLCADLSWQAHHPCVLGLPLSLLSVHNLHLPFQDARQQAQAFPYELEERLLRPAEQVESVFAAIVHTGKEREGSGADLLAFAADKELLQQILPGGREWGFDPECICPAIHALAMQAGDAARGQESLVLAHVDLHAVEIALIQSGTMVTSRRMSLLLADVDAAGHAGHVPDTLEQTALALAGAIRQGLVLFRQTGAAGAPSASISQVLLSGPLAESGALKTLLAENLQVPVQRLNQSVPGNLAPAFDAALACALQGLQPAKAGLHVFNFRQGAFAKNRGGLGAVWQRKNLRIAAALALVAAAGLLVFLAGEAQSLKLRSEELRLEMTQVFRSAFPEVQVVRDPYMEMQAALKGGAGMDSPLLFAPGRANTLSVLADISSRIPEETPLTVNRLTLDQDLALLRGQTASFKDVDQIRNSLAASPLFSEVRILSSSAEKSGTDSLIRFELRLQRALAGGSQ